MSNINEQRGHRVLGHGGCAAVEVGAQCLGIELVCGERSRQSEDVMVVIHPIMNNDSSNVRSILDGLLVRIDHVGICVADIDEAANPWTRLIGATVVAREHVSGQNVHVGWLELPGAETRLELLSSAGNTGVDRFLAKRGNAMHHIALSVTDIGEAVARIKDAGLELIDQQPRPGAGGHLVAFLHPRAMSGILVELVQLPTHV